MNRPDTLGRDADTRGTTQTAATMHERPREIRAAPSPDHASSGRHESAGSTTRSRLLRPASASVCSVGADTTGARPEGERLRRHHGLLDHLKAGALCVHPMSVVPLSISNATQAWPEEARPCRLVVRPRSPRVVWLLVPASSVRARSSGIQLRGADSFCGFGAGELPRRDDIRPTWHRIRRRGPASSQGD